MVLKLLQLMEDLCMFILRKLRNKFIFDLSLLIFCFFPFVNVQAERIGFILNEVDGDPSEFVYKLKGLYLLYPLLQKNPPEILFCQEHLIYMYG